MRRTRTIVAVALATLLAGVASAGTASAAAPGGFSQLPNPLGCLMNGGAGGCSALHDFSRSFDLVISPDGRNAYAAGFDGSTIIALSRNPANGSLQQLGGDAGCIKPAPATATCRGARFLSNPVGLAITPDGSTVYVASRAANTVLTFSRDAATGALTQRPGTTGCIAHDNTVQGPTECADARAMLSPNFLTMSNDGKQLYVSAEASNSVTGLKIDASGNLSQIGDGSGGSGCVENVPTVADGCADGRALAGPFAISADADSQTIYVASFSDAAIVAIGRDPATGRLAPISGVTGCADREGTDGCNTVAQLSSVRDVAAAPGGEQIYVPVDGTSRVLVFDRLGSGGLQLKPGTDGCVSNGAVAGCTTGRALVNPSGIAVSRDGDDVYVVGRSAGGGLVELDRNPTNGVLTPRAGTRGCATQAAVADCATTGLDPFYDVKVSADGRFIYTAVNNFGNSAASGIGVFKRDSSGPACGTSSVTVQAGSVSPISFPCSDIDGDSFNTTIIAPPTLGTLGAIDNTMHAVLYAAPQNQNGTTSFTFRSTYPDGSFPSGVGTVTVNVVGGTNPDADRDGFPRSTDCNDNNAKINPLAKEIRGNKIDENCDGIKALFLDVRSTAVPTWQLLGKTGFVMRGLLLKNLTKGWKVTVSCKGKGCPFKSKKILNKKVKKGSFQAAKKLGSKRTFRAGTKVTVKFTAPKRNTKFSIFTLKAGKTPGGTARCQTLGTKKLRACR